MLAFCGQDKCVVDANGRVKLSPRYLADFEKYGSSDVVLRCLPEGTLAVYPEAVYLQMRSSETKPAERAATSFVFRQTLRHFGSLSQSEKISGQGRLTLPQAYREHAELKAGTDAVIVGVEIGVEIWNARKWAEELVRVNSHFREKGEREMAADLMNNDLNNENRG